MANVYSEHMGGGVCMHLSLMYKCFFFFNPHLRTCLLILEGKGKREIDVGNTDQLPLVHSPAWGQALNPGVCPDRPAGCP